MNSFMQISPEKEDPKIALTHLVRRKWRLVKQLITAPCFFWEK
jgi:hypothetical protein